ncbi:MAG: nucleotidyl transferase AbiEii/AbiGii toxin family protein [Gaiellaceae bacterium]
MLSPLQERVAEIIASLEEAEGFALAGGAALILRGDVQRETRDLDFFGLTPEAVDRLLPAADRALKEAGLTVHHVQQNPGFARLVVESEGERTEVDLGADARLFPAEPGRPAPLLSGEELAVDKLLALFGRAEARDFIDLLAIESRYGLERLCQLAGEKDRGFTPAIFADMLGRFPRLARREFDLDDAGYQRLSREVERWRERALDLARHQSRDRDRERNRGPEHGLDL